jgi:uncharacterized protein
MKPAHVKGDTFEQVLSRRVARRSFLKGAASAAALFVVTPGDFSGSARAQSSGAQTLGFASIPLSSADRVVVAENYASHVVVRWGDPLFSDAPTFDPFNQTAAAQARQFGYNCDFVGFFPLTPSGSRSTAGVLVVNHEFTDPVGMFPGYVPGAPTLEQVNTEIAAQGVSIVEIVRQNAGRGPWSYVQGSAFNRRLTSDTEMEITGPAAGHPLLRVSSDSTGTRVRGTLNNCAAGKTPWGTVLTCEENFNQYFSNLNGLSTSDPRRAMHARYGLPGGASPRRWENFHSRFDLRQEPNEPFRFGWVVEVDPFNPSSAPKKRTALGRFKHEAATIAISRTGRAVAYSGDDERFDYMYKFISDGQVNFADRAANDGLLDRGTLYVARFNDDGSGEWLPLVGGQGPLANWSQAEVLINTRGAADLLGATRMDRPEDIETNPVNGKLYCVFTNNTQRGAAGRPGPNPANPRAVNRHGHIIELTEANADPGSTFFTWEIFMLCGDPQNSADGTFFAGFDQRKEISPISSPDNIAFDARGNLWISTDGLSANLPGNDGVFAVPVEGPQRGLVRQFLSAPVEAEVCGPEFTPDGLTFFCAIQHPGEGGNFITPLSTWPDDTIPPRPSVVAVTHVRDLPIGVR